MSTPALRPSVPVTGWPGPLPTVIQGGMGVAVSDWRLAHTVSSAGQLGVVSGTGIALVMVGRLTKGDPGGHVKRALAGFPDQQAVSRVLERYPAARDLRPTYPRPPMWSENPPRELEELTVLAGYAEVALAKQGHRNPVGMNLLEKIQMPTLSSLYGAMLAGVDVVIMGAGIPYQVPGVLDGLSHHLPVSYRLDVHGGAPDDELRIAFDPESLFPGIARTCGPLRRPSFLPIVSSTVLAKTLLKRASGSIEGFVVEAPTAGGHNAPPRGPLRLNDAGEPVYGAKDLVEPAQMAALGLPVWLAGGEDTPERLQQALAQGAAGVQVGTSFAFCAESGLDPTLRRRVLEVARSGHAAVRTDPAASPTGYPFKVAQIGRTLADPTVYASRRRLCDVGMLRQAHRLADGSIVWRCPAEPVAAFIAKGGVAEQARGAVCLCNALAASAGIPQTRSSGYHEAAIVTSGDGLPAVVRFLHDGAIDYTANDVLDHLLGVQARAGARQLIHSGEALT